MNPGNVIFSCGCSCGCRDHKLEVASYEPDEGAAYGTYELGVTIDYGRYHDKEWVEIGRLLGMVMDDGIEIDGVRGSIMSFELGPRNKKRLIKTIMDEGYRLGIVVEPTYDEEEE
jgi:hypothetical protein